MMWLKSCPRCTGDLFMERAIGESYVSCLQCGHTLTRMEEESLTRRYPARRRERQKRAA